MAVRYHVGQRLKTRDGCPVRIIAIDAQYTYGPIIGLVMGMPVNTIASWHGEIVVSFYDNGTCEYSAEYNVRICDLEDSDPLTPKWDASRYEVEADKPTRKTRTRLIEV